jgi:hypothetical protein
VTLVADAKPYTADVDVMAEPSKPPVHVRVVQISKTQSLKGTATGVQAVGGQVASGQFTYVNTCALGVQVANGQRLRSVTGAQFAQLGDVQIGRDSIQSVNIRAVQPGAAGNVQAGQITTIEANQFPCLGGSNVQPTGGGVDEQKKTVIQSPDIQGLQAQVVQQLKQQIGDELIKQVQRGEKLASTPYYQTPEVQTDHNVDDEVANFTMTVTQKAEGDFYLADDIDRAYAAALEKKMPVDQQLTTNRVSADVQVVPSGGGRLEFKGKVSGYVAPKMDLERVKNSVTAKSASQARVDLAKLPGVRQVDIEQSPFPTPLMPLVGSRIDLRYMVTQAAPVPRSG